MTSILERLDDLIRGSLHRFVDRALENSSLALYDQDVRDMEQAIDHLEEAMTTMYAAARANERRLEQHRQDVTRLDQRLARLHAEGVAPTTERVMVAEAQLAAKQGLVVDTQTQIERQQAQYETLKKRLAETDVIAQTLKDARPRMESLLVLARAYRSVDQVEMTLEALRGLGGDTEVAVVADSIYQRFNEAQTRLNMIESVEDLEMVAELEQAAVDDQLEERRRRLGLEPEEQEEEAVAELSLPASPEPAPDVPAPPPEAPAPEPAPDTPAPPSDEPAAEPTGDEPAAPSELPKEEGG